MATKEEKKLAAEAKAEAKAAESAVEETAVVEPKVEPEFFAGKLVLEKYEKDGGEFVVLEGGETVKL